VLRKLAFGVSILLFSSIIFISCRKNDTQSAGNFAGGNARAGRNKITYYGCPACHEISGIQTARGRVGPSLVHISLQTYLAGQLVNTPQNMALWIQKPREIEPGTAMPNMNIPDQDARDITAYLYTQN
jgi:cytochrome c2